MKRRLILFFTAVVLMLPQAIMAQVPDVYNGIFWSFHERDNNPYITLDTEPEDLFQILLDAEPDGDDYMMKDNTWLEMTRKLTDGFGNTHVIYSQLYSTEEPSEFQLVLHFRPNGSLYYRNGTLVAQPKVTPQNAKARKPVSWIPAERASIIATGSPTSETLRAIANYKGMPRDAYKVKDMKTMKYVYVDAYSGEVLYTISILHSFAPWSDVNGDVVRLSANTSYYGMQELNVMQTDKGYILRDPVRNIVTVDATDVLADLDATNIPKDYKEQHVLLMDSCNDASFADKSEFLNQKYDTRLKSFTIWLAPEMEDVPDSLRFEFFYLDENDDFLKDIIDMNVKDIAWTDDNGRKKYTITFEDRPSVDLLDLPNKVEVTMNGEVYYQYDIMLPGNKNNTNMRKNRKETNVKCFFDVEVDARQLAIDVHWGIQKIYDMYDEYFGIKGCDGKGSQTVNIVNADNNMPITEGLPLNAYAASIDITDSHGETSYLMLYGAGGSGTYRPLTAFDVTAHEFTHNVTAGSGNYLLYQTESGALNEALADCMAMVAEDYLFGEPSWLIGEKVVLYGDYMRNFADPWYSGCSNGKISDNEAQPKYYWGQYWFDYINADLTDPQSDNGGVHFNSGVFNYLFYLLCEGGMGLTNEKNETRDIYPVGMDRMKDILFHDMRYYNACLCNYSEIADNLMMAIEDIYGNDEATISDLQNKFLTAYSHVGMAPKVIPTSITTPLASTPFNSTHSTSSTTPTYNLFGIPVGDGYKGIVIRNGKKVAQGTF